MVTETTVNSLDFDLYRFTYYPNPVNDILYFESNWPIKKIIVSNMLGQHVNANFSTDNKSLDISNLPEGSYLLKIVIEGVSKRIKIVKK